MLRAILDAADEICFPAVCAHCEATGHGYPLCHACVGAIERLAAEPSCERCGALIVLDDAGCQRCGGKGLTHITRVERYCVYDGPARSLLLSAKFGRSWTSAEYLSRLAAGREEIASAVNACDGVIPIPLHAWRLWKRGYNQAEVIARVLAPEKLLAGVLKRSRSTALQSRQASAAARARNVSGAFVVAHPEHIAGKRLLLVDDILTTGSTLVEAARTLKRAGAAKVGVVVIAVADPRAQFDA